MAESLAGPGLREPAETNPKRRDRRRGTKVADLAHLADVSGRPAGTRPAVRREPPHPGALRSLFASENFRYHGFYTDQPGAPPDWTS